MTYETIRVTPLTPTLGAEIGGVELAAPGEQQVHEIGRALAAHGVVFFRDQRMSIEQHKAFGRRFGDLHVHPAYGMPGHPEVLEIKADEHSKRVAGEPSARLPAMRTSWKALSIAVRSALRRSNCSAGQA